MAVYMIGLLEIHDPEGFRKYSAATPALIARHGGRFLTRGTPTIMLEGAQLSERLVIVEFPDRAHADALFADPDYAAVSKLRHASSTGRLFLQDGV
jgi:uncharacterized protein (DUF1330 family)